MKVLLLVTARRICGEDWFNLDGLGWPEIKLIDQTNAMLTLAPGKVEPVHGRPKRPME
jgi:hypothetical protein